MLLSLIVVLSLGVGVAEAQRKRPKPQPATAEQVFKALDKFGNDDGTLTLQEYLADKTREVKNQAAKAFQEVDKEGKGLTLDQFTANFENLNIKAPPRKKKQKK